MVSNNNDGVHETRDKPPWRSTGLPDEALMYIRTHPREIFEELVESVSVGRETAPHRGIALVENVIAEIRSAGRERA